MKYRHILVTAAAFAAANTLVNAQTVNQWRGGETASAWNDPYKWKQNHTPNDEEAPYFREPISVINVNSTIQLNHGMHLYGEELSLQGNGNINLWSQVPHERTVNIPADGNGFANLTLRDNIALNGRVALSSKGFGTAASKGSLTLKDRSSVTGDLCIGKAGTGTGRVYVQDNSSYRITGLEIGTEAAAGGAAELHILSGTVQIETKDNPFEIFNEDASRRIILGANGTLRFEYPMSVAQKKKAVQDMIRNDRLTAAPGCRLTTPLIQEKRVIFRAEDERNESAVETKEQLLAAIGRIAAAAEVASVGLQPEQIDSLLKKMSSSPRSPEAPPSGESAAAVRLTQQQGASSAAPAAGSTGRAAGFIAFFGAALLMLRRSPEHRSDGADAAPKKQ